MSGLPVMLGAVHDRSISLLGAVVLCVAVVVGLPGGSFTSVIVNLIEGLAVTPFTL